MEIILHFETSFDSVFLINGCFFETGEVRTMLGDVLYLTVLPLDPALQSYTIRLLGATAIAGGELCLSYKLSDTHYYLRLLERHNYIFSTKKQAEPTVCNNIYSMFKAVKQRNFAAARALLSDELAASINNNDLEGFFAPYIDIVENKGYIPAPYGSYFLITKQGEAQAYTFQTKAGKITNIIQVEQE